MGSVAKRRMLSWLLIAAWSSAGCVGLEFSEGEVARTQPGVPQTPKPLQPDSAALSLGTLDGDVVRPQRAETDARTTPAPAATTDAGATSEPTGDASPTPEVPLNGAGVADSSAPANCEHLACAAEQLVCDDGAPMCRECEQDSECRAQIPDAPFCAAGRCAECTDNTQCTPAAPICGTNRCRVCRLNRECGSLNCNKDSGRCVLQARSVYVSGENGRIGTCGTRTEPCRWLSDAAEQLIPTRANLVLIPSAEGPADQFLELPSLSVPIQLVGNGVQTSAQVTVRSEARISDLGLANVVCEDADLSLDSVVLKNARVGVQSTNCGLDIVDSRIEGMSVAGLRSTLDAGKPQRPVRIERNLFIRNAQILRLTGSTIFSRIRNNYFVDNDVSEVTAFQSLIVLSGNGEFSYNSLVNNRTPCGTQVVVSCGPANYNLSSNLSTGNSVTEEGCVLYRCPPVSHSLAEVPVPGETNISAEALLSVQGDEFILDAKSPAIDRGDPAFAPQVDFHGNPRPSGNGPDIGATELTILGVE